MISNMGMIFSEKIVNAIIELNPQISALRLVSTLEKSYGLAHSVIAQDIFGNNRDDISSVIKDVKAYSKLCNTSFSSAAINLALQNAIPLNEQGALALTRHNEMRVISSIAASEWAYFSDKALLENSSNSMIALSSCVEMANGDLAHIPMLDLACANDASGYISAVAALKVLSTPGFLLDSGKSFHFYGKKVLPNNEFFSFLGRAALLTPIIDAPWIAHQLIEGAAALRLSEKEAYAHRPYLVCEL